MRIPFIKIDSQEAAGLYDFVGGPLHGRKLPLKFPTTTSLYIDDNLIVHTYTRIDNYPYIYYTYSNSIS